MHVRGDELNGLQGRRMGVETGYGSEVLKI
jgi:hypothetical protein